MPLYYMINKPYGCVTACTDDKYPTVMDCLTGELAAKLHPVGRLDYDTRGMLILTDDGELDHALLMPEYHVDKEYFFYAIGRLTDETIKRIENGCDLNGLGKYAEPAKIILEDICTVKDIERYLPSARHDRYMKNPNGEAFSARMIIHEGKKHQVKLMMRSVNCRICALFRTAFAGIPLDKTLGEGEYRPLNDGEKAIIESIKEKYRRIRQQTQNENNDSQSN